MGKDTNKTVKQPKKFYLGQEVVRVRYNQGRIELYGLKGELIGTVGGEEWRQMLSKQDYSKQNQS